jgi:asparagine synthase (glutamine-hydrolysing)
MGFQPYHTHLRSNLDAQPVVDTNGNMLTFDGRLDNHVELRTLLNIQNDEPSDSRIVLAVFERCGEECFSRLIGDWALALWSHRDRTLYLARDHAGTRTLFYEQAGGTFRWATYLESFFVTSVSRSLDEAYIAAYLGLVPKRNLTPYKSIRAVPPAHYLVVRDRKVNIKPHWEWMARGRIRYKSDAEHEEHFLALLRQSVERRTGPGAPVLAQLSGGMDSTSIVCMCDHLRRASSPEAELLDTISYFDDSEPNWNEKPYFSLVEARRGKAGIHIDTSLQDRTFGLRDPDQGPCLLPGADRSSLDGERIFQRLTSDKEYRVILSGIGGDELLGGVPTPSPELSDYLVSLDFGRLLRRAIVWSLASRSPLARTLLETTRFTADLYLRSHTRQQEMPPWVEPRFRKVLWDHGQHDRTKRGCWQRTPSAVSNGQTWWTILETLPHCTPASLARFEYRYPYLDKDLVAFLFRLPREQLVRPGQRRSLMRRALSGIVPTEILERKQKAFLIRGPLARLQHAHQDIHALFADSRMAGYGWIDPDKFRYALDATASGAEAKWWPALTKTIALELWLRSNPMDLRAATLHRNELRSGTREQSRSVRASRL